MTDPTPATSSKNNLTISAQPPQPFDFHAPNAGDRWLDWKLDFEVYQDISQMSLYPDTVQRGMFLNAIGTTGHKIYKTLNFDETEDKNNVATILAKFDDRLKVEKNEAYETYVFRKRAQKPLEDFDEWITDLRIKASTCNFGDALDRNLRDQLILGVHDESARQAMLSKKNPSLQDIIDLGKRFQSTKVYNKALSNQDTFHVQETSRKPDFHKRDPKPKDQINDCTYCGLSHQRGKCPAYGKNCKKCNRVGHFPRMCRSRDQRHKKKVNDVITGKQDDTSDSDDDDSKCISLLKVSTLKICQTDSSPEAHSSPWYYDLDAQNGNLKVKLDTAADCNVMNVAESKRLKLKINGKSKPLLQAFDGSDSRSLGSTLVPVTYQNKKIYLRFYIAENATETLLGRDDCVRLGLIQKLQACGSMTIIDEFQDCFTGIGTFGGPHKIVLEEGTIPTRRQARPIPAAMYDKVKKELQRMENLGVIKQMKEPTDWCSNMVVVVKPNGSVRICIDPTDLKKAVKRPNFPMGTLEDITTRMPDAKWFSTLDATTAYWQIPVDEESSKLLTFATPFGRYAYLRLPYGIPDASEVYQQRSKEFASTLPGVEVIMDDFLIWGRTREEHDERLRFFLENIRKSGIKLNPEKAKIAVQEVKYCGHVLTKHGIKPDEEKVRAIYGMQTPESKEDTQRLLGMVTYLSKFIPCVSEITAPLRELIKKDVEFHWESEQEQAFAKIKETLASAPVLTFFDVNKDVLLSADASSHGIGAMIAQEGKPVAYTSQAFTPAQKNYAQIEKELLAIQIACSKFDKYLYGRRVFVETDHKPLESIFTKPLSQAPIRLQRMLLALQRYDLVVKYVPGTKLYVADALSRAHLDDAQELDKSFQVCQVVAVTPEKWKEIQEETRNDKTLQSLAKVISQGWPREKRELPDELKSFWDHRDHLIVQDEVVFLGTRIVIPKLMRRMILNIIHEGHLGIEMSKRRAREAVFWPGMNSDIEQIVRNCKACQKHRNLNKKEPMIPHERPASPFLKLGADFFEIDGETYLLIVDYTSGYIDEKKVRSPNAKETIQFCKETFARFGIPMEFVSDNATVFTSSEFREFAKQWDITLTTSSPEYPQSNGMAERSVQILKNLKKKSKEDGSDYYLALLNFRNTDKKKAPSPAKLLMSRNLRNKLPTNLKSLKPQVVGKPKDQPNTHPERKNLTELSENQTVRMRWRNNMWKDAVVVRKLKEPRSYLVRSTDGGEYRRNRIHLAPRSTYVDLDDDPIDNVDQQEPNIQPAIPSPIADRFPKRKITTPKHLQQFEYSLVGRRNK